MIFVNRNLITAIILAVVPPISTWHDFTNADVHCWPLSASVSNPLAYNSCPGVIMDWIESPPDEIKAEKFFNVSFTLKFEAAFWDWAILEGTSQMNKQNFFSTQGISTAPVAENWCRNTACPSASSDVSQTTCCIHHVNIHSCPLETTDFCGPWIKPEGSTYTHSDVTWGNPTQEVWMSEVRGLYVTGTTQMIAHAKMAGFQLALFKNVQVKPKTECGNAVCEEEDGEMCDTCPADCGNCPLKTWHIALIVIALLVVICVPLTFILYWYRKQQKLLWDETWIIPSTEVKIGDARDFGSFVSRASHRSSKTEVSQTGDRLTNNALSKQIFTKVAMIYGQASAIRYVQKKAFVLTKEIRKEVKHVRELDHQNICKLVGVCVDVPDFCILTEYCAKGSLNDVLLNFDIPLNWAFRFSFAADVARGMKHLHVHGINHGRLTSNNCVVDDRWTVKIADFGIETLRQNEGKEEEAQVTELKKNTNVVYLPPEAPATGKLIPSQSADVYAFGVILVEIATRNEPYGDEDIDTVKPGWTPPIPKLDGTDIACPRPDLYKQLILDCWTLRPSFDSVGQRLKRINPSKQSPVDLMMHMMEKYSKHLESIVSERTADLVQEKQKTDRLLYSMLPKEVADELRLGKTMEAVQYSSCTIYFSDIVGFTSLSSQSTPMQVVGLLNKLYITFDSIIDDYDVYKVETIGDAYMVVSGVPKPNGNRHAHQVSCMALDIVRACKVFTIPHLPEEKLKIRVGLHTGSVCAGVVGLKMPRYCLFGDTVNTASRMESNGEAYKVHISDVTCAILKLIGGFDCSERGTIPVKGKGEMKTWWLNGRTANTEEGNESNISPPGQCIQ